MYNSALNIISITSYYCSTNIGSRVQMISEPEVCVFYFISFYYILNRIKRIHSFTELLFSFIVELFPALFVINGAK